MKSAYNLVQRNLRHCLKNWILDLKKWKRTYTKLIIIIFNIILVHIKGVMAFLCLLRFSSSILRILDSFYVSKHYHLINEWKPHATHNPKLLSSVQLFHEVLNVICVFRFDDHGLREIIWHTFLFVTNLQVLFLKNLKKNFMKLICIY